MLFTLHCCCAAAVALRVLCGHRTKYSVSSQASQITDTLHVLLKYDTIPYVRYVHIFHLFGAKKNKNGTPYLFQLVLGVSPRSPIAKTTANPGHWAFPRCRHKRLGYVGAPAVRCCDVYTLRVETTLLLCASCCNKQQQQQQQYVLIVSLNF